tara:strand:+ start:16311 stop:17090 length:780 start_codon:yes stop_codon:yes gene_type:complete
MIIIKIQGGLCNQLFQWAFGYSLSRRFGAKVYYDINWFQHENYLDERVDVRDFCLPNLLNIEIPLLSQDVVSEFESRPQQLINEPEGFLDFEYDSNISYYFIGYWQNEKYIKDYREEIISLINFKLDRDFDFTNSCSIHVRRGDYLNVSFAHPIPDISYYKKSLEILDPKGIIYIFSDDIDWCKENFNFENMIFMEGNSNIEDLKLMSLCENNIIANSSFSWMAAWLNQNKNKKVICPKKWFGEGMNESNIRPKEWIQI